MSVLCPFIKETCKGNQCMMWKNESCLVASFLQGALTSDELIEEARPEFEDVSEPTIPKYFKSVSSEDIASEYLEFLKREFPDSDSRSIFYEMFRFFLQSKGLKETYNIPSEINLKIEKARILAEQAKDREYQKQVIKEKDEIPSLVDQCIDWARANGLKSVRISDLETFLMEKEYELTKETMRAIYSMTNTKLKSKR